MVDMVAADTVTTASIRAAMATGGTGTGDIVIQDMLTEGMVIQDMVTEGMVIEDMVTEDMVTSRDNMVSKMLLCHINAE